MSSLYKILLLFLLFGCMPSTAQTVTGYVYNEANMPLEGVIAYIDGSTFSATTNAEGFFSITSKQKLPGQLVIRSMGYKAFKIDDPFSYGKPLKIVLQAESIEMDAVIVEGKTIFSRKQMLNAFREQFLGSSRAGRSCKIENEDDIKLRYNTSNNTLYAEASKPLRITNERLKYVITFDLIAAEIRYRVKTLQPSYITGAFFGGTTLFRDISVNGDADRQRKEAYLGSPAHFVKTIINNDWEYQKFKLYHGSFMVNPEKCLRIEDTIGIKKITIIPPLPAEVQLGGGSIRKDKPGGKKQRFEVLYDKSDQSFFLYNKGVFYANANGLFWPLYELTFGGHMGDLRMGDMLPADYRYE